MTTVEETDQRPSGGDRKDGRADQHDAGSNAPLTVRQLSGVFVGAEQDTGISVGPVADEIIGDARLELGHVHDVTRLANLV